MVFFGTADFACPSLEVLAEDPAIDLRAVVTQPDRARGRDLRLQPTPVKACAGAWPISVLQPERCRHEAFLRELSALDPELIVVAAYGQILPPALLSMPRHGCLNVHASLLPRHRGASPIQAALLHGDPETGVTLMRMDAGLDTGDIVAVERTPVGSEDNAQTLHDRLAAVGAAVLKRAWPEYIAGRLTPRPQPAEGITYAPRITREDGRLDWQRPAQELWNRVRALTPWPGTFTEVGVAGGRRLIKIWRAMPESAAGGEPGEILALGREGLLVACGQGALRLLEIQREGGRRLAAADFLAGFPLRVGERLG